MSFIRSLYYKLNYKLKSVFHGKTVDIHGNTVDKWRKAGVTVGENCEIFATASFGSEPYLISIGDHVRVNKNVEFITHDGGTWVFRSQFYTPSFKNAKNATLFGRIRVGNNVHIGTNSVIMPGVNIGNNVIIGCNAIVTRNVPDNSVFAGVPARFIETIQEYESKHLNDFDFILDLGEKEKKAYLRKKFLVDEKH